jgi:pimeloyl-ACP methyl ester carboxylesterase
MNFLFLHPRELAGDSTFKIYDAKQRDSLNLEFTEGREPHFYYSKTGAPEKNYTLENCFYPNANGDSLNAWIFRPTVPFNGTTLFFVHGNAGNVVYNYRLVTPFVERGYKVFLFDYSGFGFSQGKSTRKNVLKDGNSSFEYLLSMEEFKDDNILIYGQSLGGHLATVLAKQNQHNIDGLVIEGAFSSHDDIAADRASFLGRWFVGEFYSAKDSIPLIEKPILVIHSRSDAVIPFEHGKLLYETATEPKAFYEIDSAHVLGPLYFADSIVAKMNRLF